MIVTSVNLLAILGATALSMIIGFIWYSPMIFGKTWMRLSGITEDQMKVSKKLMFPMYGLSFLSSLILSFVLALFINLGNDTTILQGLTLSFWIWLGFIVTTHIYGVIFAGKPIKLYLIDIFYQLLSLFGMSIVLISWS